MRNTQEPWYSSGTNTGTGYTKFGSWGLGAQIGATLAMTNRFRFGLFGIAEYVQQKATLEFTPTAGTLESLKIGANTPIIGGGFSGEIYLGDLWSLSLMAGYEHGLDAHWKTRESATFMGTAYNGDLLNALGDPAEAKFGGFLFELSFKLSFYQ